MSLKAAVPTSPKRSEFNQSQPAFFVYKQSSSGVLKKWRHNNLQTETSCFHRAAEGVLHKRNPSCQDPSDVDIFTVSGLMRWRHCLTPHSLAHWSPDKQFSAFCGGSPRKVGFFGDNAPKKMEKGRKTQRELPLTFFLPGILLQFDILLSNLFHPSLYIVNHCNDCNYLAFRILTCPTPPPKKKHVQRKRHLPTIVQEVQGIYYQYFLGV